MNNPTTWLNAIWKSELPSQSKLLAAYLRRFMNDDSDMAYPSLSRISCETSQARPTVVKYLNVLEEKGFLLKESGNSKRSNRYISNLPCDALGSKRGELPSKRGELGVVNEVNSNKQGLNKQSNKPSVSYVFIQDQFNAFCTKLQSIRTIGEGRKKTVKARFSLLKTEDDWLSYFKTIAASDYLNGLVKDWKADFDWLINETNMIKVLEGKYTDKNTTPAQPTRTYRPMPKPGE